MCLASKSSVTPFTSVVIALVDESGCKNATTLPTRLHHMSVQYQGDNGRAAWMCTCAQGAEQPKMCHVYVQTARKHAIKQPASSSTTNTHHQHTPTRRNGNGNAAQQGPECMGLGQFPVCRIVRIRRIVWVYPCKPRATWNEVGLFLLREMLRCVSLSLKSVAGALIVGRGRVVCPSAWCG